MNTATLIEAGGVQRLAVSPGEAARLAGSAELEPNGLILQAIESAEVVSGDPLANLAEKTTIDPGAAFVPEVLEALAALKQRDRSSFESLRSSLRTAGCRVTSLDKAIAQQNGSSGNERAPTQADILISFCRSPELFRTHDGIGFADIEINGHRETWPIRSTGFRQWMRRCYFEQTGGAPSSEALQSAVGVIESRAHFDAPERRVYTRVAGVGGLLYLDLCNENWQAIEVDAKGWRIVDAPPVRIRRTRGMKPCRYLSAADQSQLCVHS